MEDEDDAMLEAESLESIAKLVGLRDIDRKVAARLWIGDQRDDRAKPTSTPVLVGRGVDEQPLEPWRRNGSDRGGAVIRASNG